MAGRIGRLLAFFTQAEPRGAPSGWALALDAAVAVGAAAAAVSEMAERADELRTALPGGGIVVTTPAAHASAAVLAAAALTALPLAGRRLYPITAWLVIIAAIVAVQPPSCRRSRSAPPCTPPTARSPTAGTGTWRSPW